MKLTKKLISLTMAVIMMITATPILQAEDLANLDIEELNELKSDIMLSIMDSYDFKEGGKIDEEIPSREELQNRYKEAIKRYNKLNTRKARKAVKEKKQEALEIAKQMKEFDQFETDEEKAEVAFYTFLFDSTLKAEQEMVQAKSNYYGMLSMFSMFGFSIGYIVLGRLVFNLPAATDWLVVGVGCGVIASLLALVFISKPAGAGSVVYHRNWDLIKYDFLNKPFYSVGDQYNKDKFASLYLDEKARPVLRDIVNIEYYVSHNPSTENMMYRIFPHTLYWTKMNPDQQEEYLHKAAEILEKKTTEYKMPFLSRHGKHKAHNKIDWLV